MQQDYNLAPQSARYFYRNDGDWAMLMADVARWLHETNAYLEFIHIYDGQDDSGHYISATAYHWSTATKKFADPFKQNNDKLKAKLEWAKKELEAAIEVLSE